MKAPHEMRFYGRDVKAGEELKLRPQLWPPKADKEGKVQAFVESVISRKSEILEFGSGGSTIWFARHAKSVLAFENNPLFHRLVMSEIGRRRLTKRAIVLLDPKYPRIGFLPKHWKGDGFRWARKQYDFILNDGSNRVACAQMVFRLLRPGGYVMCTDTNKAGAQKERMIYQAHGFKYIPILPGHRAAWRKPG